jgi:hypothetical protein
LKTPCPVLAGEGWDEGGAEIRGGELP